jgi:hypothetical protein
MTFTPAAAPSTAVASSSSSSTSGSALHAGVVGVSQHLFQDFEDLDEVNKQLEKM